DAGLRDCSQERGALGHFHLLSVDSYTYAHAGAPNCASALRTWVAAVWPRPQIDADCIACPRSIRRSVSAAAGDPCSRWRISTWRTVPTRHGTHWPHDSSAKNSAKRRTISHMSTLSLKAMIAPEPIEAPIARSEA